jgi:hypothetical protein
MQFSFTEREGWECYKDRVWYTGKINKFTDTVILDEYALLDWLKKHYGAEYLVPSTNLFLNRNRLSLQVPMVHIYYTESIPFALWGKLGIIEVRYFKHAWELEALQKEILK